MEFQCGCGGVDKRMPSKNSIADESYISNWFSPTHTIHQIYKFCCQPILNNYSINFIRIRIIEYCTKNYLVLLHMEERYNVFFSEIYAQCPYGLNLFGVFWICVWFFGHCCVGPTAWAPKAQRMKSNRTERTQSWPEGPKARSRRLP